MRRRDFRKGEVVRFHLADGDSVEGVFQASTRRFHVLIAGRIEVSGTFHASVSERIHVPRGLVKLAEVMGA